MRPSLGIVVLAAGNGSRMHSSFPKPLLRVGGRPMLGHIASTVRQVLREPGDRLAVVCSPQNRHELEQVVLRYVPNAIFVEQAVQDGSASAFECGLKVLETDLVMNLFGDVPLIRTQTLKNLIRQLKQDAAEKNTDGIAVLTAGAVDPTGYGRVIRSRSKGNRVINIVEEVEATQAQREIKEIFTGVMVGYRSVVVEALAKTEVHESTGERHLPDVVAVSCKAGVMDGALAINIHDIDEVSGANTRRQLHRLERYLQLRTVEALLDQGAGIADVKRVDIRGELKVGHDVWIDVNTVFEGDVALADEVQIGPNCVLKDCTIGRGTVIEPNSYIEGSHIGANCTVGPFARLRPDTVLEDDVQVGNFSEIKASTLRSGTKAKHVSTILDADVGNRTNLSAGIVFANYDGVNKHRIVVGDRAMIGSGSVLCAPVSIGDGAYVAAGTTITQDLDSNKLGINKGRRQVELRLPPSVAQHAEDPDSSN